MALEIEMEDIYGNTHPAAYARISKVQITNPPLGDKKVQTEVWVYTTQAAYAAGKSPVWGRTYQVEDEVAVQEKEGSVVMECAVDPDAVTVADCYLWLKEQDTYKTPKDV